MDLSLRVRPSRVAFQVILVSWTYAGGGGGVGGTASLAGKDGYICSVVDEVYCPGNLEDEAVCSWGVLCPSKHSSANLT